MHRLHLLRWLSLPIGLTLLPTLLLTRCVDSLSDDCAKTLTCGEPQVTLDENCEWRYPDGGLWTEGPTQDPMTQRWKWPDGTETATQTFRCAPNGAGGADGGAGEPDCTVEGFVCDEPRQCDQASRRCVECLSNEACAANVPMGDAGAAGICDIERRECVQCLVNDDCSGSTPVCRAYGNDSDRNECVECTVDSQCGSEEPVCDPSTNQCTLRCDNPEDCSASADKPVCNIERALCVECTASDSSACSGATSQCNIETSQCVQCVNNGPCDALGQVCDLTSNRCVQCLNDTECEGVAGQPSCDTETNLCVACLGHDQCTAPGASRCNSVTHTCVGCTASAQCEGGAVCDTQSGACVECTSAEDCSMRGITRQCELGTKTCVECLDSSTCLTADAAHCATEPEAPAKFACVGCTGNADCGKPGMGGLCRTATGECVECLELAGCSDNPNASFCSNAGSCVPCANDGHCAAVRGLNACLVAGDDTRCVECTNNTHCVGNSDGAVCKTSNSGAAAGPGNINECVECVSNADCTNPSASKCVQNECVPCQQNGDCSALPGLGICDASGGADGGDPECVQCTGLERGACANGANVCNSLTRQCTNFAVGSAPGDCDACVSDAHCRAGARCLQQRIGSDGFFCFPVNNPGCNASPFSLVTTGTIDDDTATACTPRRTTCAAFLDFARQACEDDADCGEGIGDGVCASEVCSLPCTTPADCAGGTCSGATCLL